MFLCVIVRELHCTTHMQIHKPHTLYSAVFGVIGVGALVIIVIVVIYFKKKKKKESVIAPVPKVSSKSSRGREKTAQKPVTWD